MVSKGIVIFGPVGSGKGTYSKEILSRVKNCFHISTGDMLRALKNSDNPKDQAIQKLINGGKFAPDNLVLKMVATSLEQTDGVPLFDGIPRNLYQLEIVEKWCEKHQIDLDFILIDATDETCIKRVLQRKQLSGREDDSEEMAIYRLETYHRLTEPAVLAAARKYPDKFHSIDANKDISDPENQQRLSEIIEKISL